MIYCKASEVGGGVEFVRQLCVQQFVVVGGQCSILSTNVIHDVQRLNSTHAKNRIGQLISIRIRKRVLEASGKYENCGHDFIVFLRSIFEKTLHVGVIGRRNWRSEDITSKKIGAISEIWKLVPCGGCNDER